MTLSGGADDDAPGMQHMEHDAIVLEEDLTNRKEIQEEPPMTLSNDATGDDIAVLETVVQEIEVELARDTATATASADDTVPILPVEVRESFAHESTATQPDTEIDIIPINDVEEPITEEAVVPTPADESSASTTTTSSENKQSSFLHSTRYRAAQVQRRMRERSQYLLHMHENMPQFTSKVRQSLDDFIQRARQVVDSSNTSTGGSTPSVGDGLRAVQSSVLALGPTFFGLMCQSESDGKYMTLFGVAVMSVLGTGMGFVSFLYFLSLGYAASLGLSAAFALWAFNVLPARSGGTVGVSKLSNVHTSLVLLWAVRMFAFLFHREFVNWPQWHKSIKEADSKTSLESKVMAWLACSAFYAILFLPCLFRMQADTSINWGFVGKTGITLQIFGLALESIADAQKASFKARGGDDSNRNIWCNEGIWKYSTHPNYLGESIFWIGTYLGGIGAESVMQRIITSVGLACILSVMKSSAGRLSASQWQNYKDDQEFVRFRDATSMLGPKYSPFSMA